jgi:CheY-like chemotaxis protein
LKKMLLVEDDKHLSKMYSKKFNDAGWDVTSITNGAESIQVAKQGLFDIVVLDLMLPGMSGVDVLEILRSDSKTVKTPVIVYTNYGDSGNREKCLTYGADEFILKVDSTPESLLRSIERVASLKAKPNLNE